MSLLKDLEPIYNKLITECGLYQKGTELFYAVNPQEYFNHTGGYRFLYMQHIFLSVQAIDSKTIQISFKNCLGNEIDGFYKVKDVDNLIRIIKNCVKEIKDYRYKQKLERIKEDFV